MHDRAGIAEMRGARCARSKCQLNGLRAQTASTAAMTLVVDETQAARRISFVHEELGVQPGALALAYPRWIPGEHGPTGSIQDVASLQIRFRRRNSALDPRSG